MSNRKKEEVIIVTDKNGQSAKAKRRKRQRQRRNQNRKLDSSGQSTQHRSIQAIGGFDRFSRPIAGVNHQAVDRNLLRGPRVAKRVAARTIVAEYADVQGAIVAPQVCPPERYSTEYSSKPTAVSNPWSIVDYPWAQSQSGPLDDTELFTAAFRDPLRSMIFYDPNESAFASLYQAYMTPIIGASTDPMTTVSFGNVVNIDQYIEVAYWLSTPVAPSTYSPHGPKLYCGTDGETDLTYRWFDRDENIAFIVDLGASVAWGIDVVLTEFRNDAHIENAQVGANSGTSAQASLNMTVEKEGYYAIHVFTNLASSQTQALSMYSDTTGPVFCHRALPALENNFLSVESIRIVGVSLMYTNNAAPIQRAGTISGYQVPKEQDWQDFIGPLSLVSTLNDAVTKDIVNGMYGFLKPTEPTDFELIDVYACNPTTGTLTASFFPLRNVKSYIIIRGTVPPAEGRSGFITFAASCEYLTSDVWRTVDIARTDPDVYKKALDQLKTVVQWHENPTHVKELFKNILNGATSLIKGVQRYAPQALSIAEVLGTMLA